MLYWEDKIARRSGGRLESLNVFFRPIVLNIFFFLKGFALENANTTCSFFLCVCVCVCDRWVHKKAGEGCISVYVKRVGVLFESVQKSLFLICPSVSRGDESNLQMASPVEEHLNPINTRQT